MVDLRNLEILFWTFSVHLMKNPRLVRTLLVGLVVVFFAGVVIAVGALLQPVPTANNDPAEFGLPPIALEENPTVAEPPKLLVEQKNLLVILVDSFGVKKPVLKGVWLVGRTPSVPQIVFLPVYPAGQKTQTELWTNLIILDPAGLPSESFRDFLNSRNIRWDHYLLLDETTLAEIAELAGGIDWNGIENSGLEIVTSLPDARAAPEAAMMAQAKIASELCLSGADLIQNIDPEILWGLLTHRMRSDFELVTLEIVREQLRQTGEIPACAFPTLREMTYWTGVQ
jgi:hypothetical protein